jgi:prevent-host-death family protein
MAKQSTVSATDVRRHFGDMLKRAHNNREHLIVERDGYPVAVIMSFDGYESMMKECYSREFDEHSRKLGLELEKQGLSEEEVMDELEEVKKEVFRQRYGDL